MDPFCHVFVSVDSYELHMDPFSELCFVILYVKTLHCFGLVVGLVGTVLVCRYVCILALCWYVDMFVYWHCVGM